MPARQCSLQAGGCSRLYCANRSTGFSWEDVFFLLGCANVGNRQVWHSADTAMLKVKFPRGSRRFFGCQGAECPQGLSLGSGVDTAVFTVPVTGQAESGLCSHAISWLIVTVFASATLPVSLVPGPVLCGCICHSTPAL